MERAVRKRLLRPNGLRVWIWRHTASGVLLDAIAWEKPVIARKIPIFEAMFEKHGELGYLFNDDTELKAIVERIVQAAEKSRYSCQVQNLGVRESPGIRKPWQPHIKNCAGKTGSSKLALKRGHDEASAEVRHGAATLKPFTALKDFTP
jgi:hypothetical protein